MHNAASCPHSEQSPFPGCPGSPSKSNALFQVDARSPVPTSEIELSIREIPFPQDALDPSRHPMGGHKDRIYSQTLYMYLHTIEK